MGKIFHFQMKVHHSWCKIPSWV